jgi:hypothetical protein
VPRRPERYLTAVFVKGALRAAAHCREYMYFKTESKAEIGSDIGDCEMRVRFFDLLLIHFFGQ